LKEFINDEVNGEMLLDMDEENLSSEDYKLNKEMQKNI
jgi:hypothetical protein